MTAKADVQRALELVILHEWLRWYIGVDQRLSSFYTLRVIPRLRSLEARARETYAGVLGSVPQDEGFLDGTVIHARKTERALGKVYGQRLTGEVSRVTESQMTADAAAASARTVEHLASMGTLASNVGRTEIGASLTRGSVTCSAASEPRTAARTPRTLLARYRPGLRMRTPCQR